MKILGLICEYNPFHNGHAYHLAEGKRLANADRVIVVMSGDFVQRGAPAMLDKYRRTRMALACGADLVIELPTRYALGSAEYFAFGGVSLLDSLGCIDALCFGSELGTIAPFLSLAPVLDEEPLQYSELLRRYLKDGLSFPSARAAALADYFHTQSSSGQSPARDLDTLLASPNNILGIEYCKALHHLSSPIRPITLKRCGDDYHEIRLTGTSLASASAIRTGLLQADTFDLSSVMPEESFAIVNDAAARHELITADDYSLLLRCRLLSETPASLQQYQDISGDLANRILANIEQAGSFSDFVTLLKTRDMTYTRIARGLMHILLGIPSFAADVPIPYARILGFRNASSDLLGILKKNSRIPLVTNVNPRKIQLPSHAASLLDEDIRCANLYETVRSHKSGQPFIHEYRRQFLKL